MRYIRQEKLKEIGKKGQVLIRNSKIAIIGVGALGTVSAELLTRAGIGELLLVDNDKIDLLNLQRQTLFQEKHEGKYKVDVAKKELQKINSEVKIKIKKTYFKNENSKLLNNYDLILDCTDNMHSRHIINEYAKKQSKTWIYCAAVGTQANMLVVKDYDKFKEIFKSNETLDSCSKIGVTNTITNFAASIQVNLALKLILKQPYTKDLIRFDIWNNEFKLIKIK